jgi:hypothetical protein
MNVFFGGAMRIALGLLGLFFGLIISSLAHADTVTTGSKTQTFTNTDCAKTDSCDLKDWVVKQEDFKLTIPSHNITAFGSRMHTVYNTSSLDTLEKYGIAQFIRGCVFYSQVVDGKVVREFDQIEHYGKIVPFHFPQDVIDGFVKDPIDWGAEEGMPSRHFFYLNKFIGSQEPQPKDRYGIQKPTIPRLYLRDIPGVAQVMQDGSAKNISLQFRICIYKSADVPKVVEETNLTFATPLQCFNWNNSFVYNHGLKKYEQPADIVDFCK